MNDALHHAWTQLVTASDLDDHMHQVGQAAANAALLASMFAATADQRRKKLLIVGGGTAQFLDYVPAATFARFGITLTDINPDFLARAQQRFQLAGITDIHFVIDDIEHCQLTGQFDANAIVLVLEHIDWRRGIQQIQRLAPDELHLIIQRNPESQTSAFAPQRKLNASMQAFADTAHPNLIAPDDLIQFLTPLGYRLKARDERPVPDQKTMVGLSFKRDD
jgi:Methyltransferase domain